MKTKNKIVNRNEYLMPSITKKQASKMTQRKRQNIKEQELEEEYEEWKEYIK